jgi:putative transcriptional regulator
MQEFTYLSNHFLIAMPGLADPNFFQTVTYICSHNSAGALGIVINRPMKLTFGELLKQLQITPVPTELSAEIIYSGGPVQREQGFVLHTPMGNWESTLKVTDNIGITTSRDILEALAHQRKPGNVLMALGYAGWGAGQLEQEMVDNAWLSGPADADILFHTPVEQRWSAAAAAIGVVLNLLSGEAGHA